MLGKHSTYQDFLRVATPDERTYFAFAGIRNPLDVTVSRFVQVKTDARDRFTDPGKRARRTSLPGADRDARLRLGPAQRRELRAVPAALVLAAVRHVVQRRPPQAGLRRALRVAGGRLRGGDPADRADAEAQAARPQRHRRSVTLPGRLLHVGGGASPRGLGVRPVHARVELRLSRSRGETSRCRPGAWPSSGVLRFYRGLYWRFIRSVPTVTPRKGRRERERKQAERRAAMAAARAASFAGSPEGRRLESVDDDLADELADIDEESRERTAEDD